MGNQADTVLNVDRSQAVFGTVMTRIPFRLRGGARIGALADHARTGACGGRGRSDRALRTPAVSHCEINQSRFRTWLAAHHSRIHRSSALRSTARKPQFNQRTSSGPGAASSVDDEALRHLTDLVDTVGELVAAILDVDAGGTVRNIAAIDIGYAGHATSHTFGYQKNSRLTRNICSTCLTALAMAKMTTRSFGLIFKSPLGFRTCPSRLSRRGACFGQIEIALNGRGPSSQRARFFQAPPPRDVIWPAALAFCGRCADNARVRVAAVSAGGSR